MKGFETLTSENVRAAGEKGILVLPVGSVEQHGPHLPLTVDTEIPLRVASLLVERIEEFVAPPSYGTPAMATSTSRGSVRTGRRMNVEWPANRGVTPESIGS